MFSNTRSDILRHELRHIGNHDGYTTGHAWDAENRNTTVTSNGITILTNAYDHTTHTEYDAADNITAQWGATYPVRYTYDAANRKTTMRTFRDAPGGAGAPPAYRQPSRVINQRLGNILCSQQSQSIHGYLNS